MQKNYNENLVAGAAIRDDKGRRISKLFEASHPKMTVGYAKNLIMPDTPAEQEFNFRQAGGGVIEDGVAVIDKVKGNSVVWNQRIKMQLAETRTINGITFTKNPYGSITASGTATANATYHIPCDSMVAGHRYLFCASDNGSASTYGFEVANKTGNDVFEFDSNLFNPTIITPSQNGIEGFFALRVWAGATVNVVYRPQSIDLTQMFGAGNEPATVEEFLSRKPKVADEYAYNEGEVVHNHTTAVKSEGINLWDGTLKDGSGNDTALIKALPNTRYHILSGNPVLANWEGWFSVTYYNADKSAIGELSYGLSYAQNEYCYFTTPQGCAYFGIERLGLIENSISVVDAKICINISDPATNGQYFPYEKHELDLSWVKDIKDGGGVALFEDGMKSAGTAFDEVGKNKAVKRLGVKVFDGTENWMFSDNIEGRLTNVCFLQMGDDFGALSKGDVVNMICSNYEQLVGYYSEGSLLSYFNTVGYRIPKQLTIKDSAYTTSVETWKSHLADLYAQGNPLKIVYELAEPIEVEYDEKNLTYPVVAGGTEEAIASKPSTALRADIGYGIDAVKTILDLKARVEALEGK